MKSLFRRFHSESISAVGRLSKKAVYSFREAAKNVLSVVPMPNHEWKSKTRPFLVCRLRYFARNVMDLRLVAVGQVARLKGGGSLLEQRHHPWCPPFAASTG